MDHMSSQAEQVPAAGPIQRVAEALMTDLTTLDTDVTQLTPLEASTLRAGLEGCAGDVSKLAVALLQRWDALTTSERVSTLLVMANLLAKTGSD
jgi:hypothetical protein